MVLALLERLREEGWRAGEALPGAEHNELARTIHLRWMTASATSVTAQSSIPCQEISQTNRGAIIDSSGSRGGRFITPGRKASAATSETPSCVSRPNGE